MSLPRVEIKIILRGVDECTAVLRRASDSVKQLTNSIQGLKDAAKIAAGVLIRDFALSLGRNIKEASELGAKYASLRSAFRNLVGDVDEANQLFRELRRATRGTVSAVKLLQAANQALALGLPKDELADLFEAAMRLGHAMGKDTVSSIDDLVTGLGRLSGKILDNLGIVVKTEEAYEWYAKQLGKTVNELTELERRTAWQLYAMEQIKKKADEVGDSESKAQENMERWRATIEDFKTTVGRVIGPLGQFGDAFSGILTPTILLIDKWEKLGGVLSKVMGPISAVLSLLGPWKWAILGIIATTLLLAYLWKHNIFGIRDITKQAVDAIVGSLRRIGEWLDNLGQKWVELQRKASEALNFISERLAGRTIEEIVHESIDKARENLDKAVQLMGDLSNLVREEVKEPILELERLGGGYTPPPIGVGPWGGAERFATGVIPVNVTNIVHVDRVEKDFDLERALDILERRRMEAYRRLI